MIDKEWKPCEPLFTLMGKWRLNRFYQEITYLHRTLRNAGIPHVKKRNMDGWQLCYPNEENCVCSIIENIGSYGHEKDLLEIDGLLTLEEKELDWVAGYLTAKDVYERINAHWMKEREKEHE